MRTIQRHGMRTQRWQSNAVLLVAVCLTCSQSAAQRLEYPSESPVDRPISVRGHGLPVGTVVTLRTSVIDAADQLWAARAEFRTDTDGTIDTGRDPSLSGSYEGVETGGLFNRMHAVGDSTGRLRFQTSGLRNLAITILLEEAGGARLDSLIVERFFLGPKVQVTTVSDSALRGRLFSPSRSGAPGVVVLGGSEGGFPDQVAALLATNGFFALSLAYFRVDGLPSELAEIPLDYVGRAIEWLGTQLGVWPDRIALFGTSKGAEAALMVASHVPEVQAVVAYAPSSVVWSCICSQPGLSSWTLRGDPVAAVSEGADPDYRPAAGEPIRWTANYLYRLRQAPVSTVIPVERIAGPLLLVAGGEDQLWPSLVMAQAIMERRASFGGHSEDQLLAYPLAGHLIGKAYLPPGSTRVGGGRFETGGTPEQNALAQADAWPRVLAFLAKAVGR